MGIEFTITKDLATVSATISELAAVNAILCAEIDSADFQQEYASLLADILNTYRVVNRVLRPLVEVNTLAEFQRMFADCHDTYSQIYQPALSEPRINAEYTYEKYLQFRKRKETRTSYPILKRSFSRLHDFIDKWIDNDIWLAMTIDTLFKMVFRFLGEISAEHARDTEMAFASYLSVFSRLPPYLDIIESHTSVIDARLARDSPQRMSSAG